jgi:hypothetical protein
LQCQEADWVRPGSGGDSRSHTLFDLFESSVERALVGDRGSPEKSCLALARLFRTMGVDAVLGRLTPERREQLKALPPEQLASEYIEDTALDWAGKRLSSADHPSGQFVVEEDVVRVLGRSLKATQMADRLAQKLAKFIQDFAVPASVQQKIREELRWTSMSNKEKRTRLLGIARYSSLEFRRLMDYVKELVGKREAEQAAAIATHYLDFLDEDGVEIQIEELSRIPELIHSLPLAASDKFVAKAVERLDRVLQRRDGSEFVHFQAANALAILAQSIAPFEHFEQILAIGVGLERSQQRDPDKHTKCCASALHKLLPPSAIERIIELFLAQRDNPAWAKTAVTLLRFAGPLSVESVFDRLIKEDDRRNRFILLRLIAQLGVKSSIEVALRYLKDDRWYVVRNMCGVLAELKDQELACHVRAALQHSDVRVQQAALTALVKCQASGRGEVLAASLLSFAPSILEQVLDELMFLRQPESVLPLEEFISRWQGNLAVLKKATRVLDYVPGEAALNALGRLLHNQDLAVDLRKLILSLISKRRTAAAGQILRRLAEAQDPLAGEALRLVKGGRES